MFKKIAVLGAGTMGRGIAQVFARNGIIVALYGRNPDTLEAAKKILGDKIAYVSNLADAVMDADLIIETVTENVEMKKELYRQMTPFLKKDAIVASNTSTYSLELLAENQAFSRHMLIVHFINPAAYIPLVEVVQLAETMPGIADRVIGLLRSCGKEPVLLKQDISGFIVNRLQAAIMREACYLVQAGIADPSQIDKVVSEGLGLRWAVSGPFEIADLGGLDVWEKVTGHLLPKLDPSVQAPEAISQKVQLGELGAKSGKGFYEYGDASARERKTRLREQKFVEITKLKQAISASEKVH